MRRKRKLLQVSTFSFLAVLLCAMGALILFLLVMDRRAKIVARNKALAAQAIAQEQVRKQETEIDSRRQERRALLAGQHAQVAEQRQLALRKVNEAHDKVKQNEIALTNVKQRLADETTATQRAQLAVEKQRAELAAAKNQAGVSQGKLRQLAAELERLEKTLEQLKAANARPDEVVALVPYRGSKAEQRRPIYVECRGDGLVLHPDRQILITTSSDPLEIRRAIEDRMKANTSAYVLFLVRPDGIPLYYRAQAALEGLRLDFGYEFVDADWTLELPPATEAVVQNPNTPTPEPLTLGPAPWPSRSPSMSTAGAPGGAGPRLASSVGARRNGIGPSPRMMIESKSAPAPSLHGGHTAEALSTEPVFRPAKPAPPPVGRLLGNRHLTIVLVCTRDGVLFQTTNELHPLGSLKPSATGEHRIAQEIRELVTRRQAGLQTGESPYQPSIRFRIHPDGLRAYYFVYPLLENLRIPMTRENIQ